jgi:pyruvate/2-oxoglutarate dehydrogenase complex dihydrolipoamide dehydrogenase (E3) component
MTERFDVVVIGAGAAGLVTAGGCAMLGRSVALIEAGEMGGDCLNTGCVPSKALLAAGHAAQAQRTAARFGVATREPAIDWAGVRAHVAGVIETIAPVDSQERFEGLGCTVIRDWARFLDPRTVEVGGRRLTAKWFVIASGATALVPPIPGLADTPHWTNETIFTLAERPEHLIVLGGGPIGVEMAQAHRRLGCAVTLIERETILPKDDPELVPVVRAALLAEGVSLIEGQPAIAVEPGPTVVLSDGRRITGSHLLVALGRAPRVASMGLEAAGVTYTPRGITVDARLRTSQRRIFAIGDCREGPQFTHAAGYDAGIVIRQMMFRLPAKANYSALPWVTYSDPELAHIGLTEAQARACYGDALTVLRWPFHENDRAIAERVPEGLLKVMAVKGRAVGASIVGPHAGEYIQTWGLMISQRLKLSALAGQIIAYPTFGEVNKRAAGSLFSPMLSNPRVQALVRLLNWLP